MKSNNVKTSTNVEAVLSLFRPYFEDETVNEIRVNRYGEVVTEHRDGKCRLHEDSRLTKRFVQSLTSALCHYNMKGQGKVNDLQLPDGSRGIIILPPAALKGTVLICFRKHLKVSKSIRDYSVEGRFKNISVIRNTDSIDLNSFEKYMLQLQENNEYEKFFEQAVKNKLNIAIAGSTGSGKSTFTQSLIDEIPSNERLLIMEDVHEVGSSHHDEVGYLSYGESGTNRLSAEECLKTCMRLTPDRIILTELRDEAAWDYLDSANTGHPGSIFSVHASSAKDTPHRIAKLVKQSPIGRTLDQDTIMKTIIGTIDLVVYLENKEVTEVLYDPLYKKQVKYGEK